MRRAFIILLVLLFSFTLAQAQEQSSSSQATDQQYISVTGGLPIINMKYGFNAFGNVGDLRVRVGVTPIWGFAVNTGLDALVRLNPEDDSGLYAGGGVGFIYRNTDVSNPQWSENLWTLGGAFTIGNESRISNIFSFVSEASFGIDYTINTTNDSSFFGPGIRFGLGVRYYP